MRCPRNVTLNRDEPFMKIALITVIETGRGTILLESNIFTTSPPVKIRVERRTMFFLKLLIQKKLLTPFLIYSPLKRTKFRSRTLYQEKNISQKIRVRPQFWRTTKRCCFFISFQQHQIDLPRVFLFVLLFLCPI